MFKGSKTRKRKLHLQCIGPPFLFFGGGGKAEGSEFSFAQFSFPLFSIALRDIWAPFLPNKEEAEGDRSESGKKEEEEKEEEDAD